MTGSPFSNVLGTDPDSSTFSNVESTQIGDTTHADAISAVDAGTEPSFGVELHSGVTQEAGEDETAGESDLSGTPNPS